jgi:ABC-type spermidine/putrescine transport system permease subunit II
MDDQRADRTGGIIRDVFWWAIVFALLIAGLFGGVFAWYGFVAAAKNYDPALAMVLGAGTFGFITGTAYGFAMSFVVRRYRIRFTRYSIRDILILLTIAAIALGIALNVFNKT